MANNNATDTPCGRYFKVSCLGKVNLRRFHNTRAADNNAILGRAPERIKYDHEH